MAYMFSNDFKFTEGEAASFSVVFQVIRSVNFVNPEICLHIISIVYMLCEKVFIVCR